MKKTIRVGLLALAIVATVATAYAEIGDKGEKICGG
ncbi:hypothetical protein LCGC14_2601660 [marine sediment metagenome]|uniref:Uncharacterized protein n=1 Tax=marine sediment metagenome TaxID=412755 RepID=A0A0F9CJK1_9ZZZZ